MECYGILWNAMKCWRIKRNITNFIRVGNYFTEVYTAPTEKDQSVV